MYGSASLVALGVVMVGWAALALAQSPGGPPAPAPVQLPVIQTGATGPAPMPPAPVMPATPGSIPTPAPAPVSPTPAPATPASAPTPSPTAVEPASATGPALITGQPTADVDNVGPTGRQEPAVSVEWVGPAAGKVGQANDYAVVVRNACNIPVQQVLVRVRLAGAANVLTAEPKPAVEDNVLSWEVGTLQPKEEKMMRMRMAPSARGDVAAQAWVTFTGFTAMKVRVREAKLAVKAVGPDRVLVGDPAAFTLTAGVRGVGRGRQWPAGHRPGGVHGEHAAAGPGGQGAEAAVRRPQSGLHD
jgi:hypothetical protein